MAKKRRTLANASEEACARELERRGFKVSKRGWPDLIAIRRRNKSAWTALLVEVKPDRRAVSRHQAVVMNLLRSAGLNVCRWDPVDGLQPFTMESQRQRKDIAAQQADRFRAKWKKEQAQLREQAKAERSAKTTKRLNEDGPLWRLGLPQ